MKKKKPMRRLKTGSKIMGMNYKYHLLPLLLIAAVSCIVFSNSFQGPFFLDDLAYIEENEYIRDIGNIPFFFSPGYWREHNPMGSSTYRPLRSVSFALDYWLWELNPTGYHLTNRILHTACCLLIYYFINIVAGFRKRRRPVPGAGNFSWRAFAGIPFLTTLFFTIHPIHTETVVWIKYRLGIMICLFALLSLLGFFRSIPSNIRPDDKRTGGTSAYCFSLFFYLLGIMTKETIFSVPLLLCLYIAVFFPVSRYRRASVKTVPYFVLFLAYFASKQVLSGKLTLQEWPFPITLGYRFTQMAKTYILYLWWLIWPWDLNIEHQLPTYPPIAQPLILGSVVTVAALCIIAVRCRNKRPLVSFSIGWVLITIFPVSNVIPIMGRRIAEARLYVPSLGFCLLLTLGIHALLQAGKRPSGKRGYAWLGIVLAAGITIAYSAVTIRRNFDWRNPTVLYEKAHKSAPESIRALRNLADSYRLERRLQEAEKLFLEALERDRREPNVYYTPADRRLIYYRLGGLYTEMNRPGEAVTWLEKCVAEFPSFLKAYNDLALVYTNLERYNQAVATYRKIIDIFPTCVSAYINLGNLFGQLGRAEAVDMYEQALKIDPENPGVHINLGVYYNHSGQQHQAEKHLKRAVEIAPGIPETYNALADFYLQHQRFPEAVQAFKKSLTIKAAAPTYTGLGVVYLQMEDIDTAVSMLTKALELDAAYAPAYNHLTFIHYVKGHHRKAQEYCDKAAELLKNGGSKQDMEFNREMQHALRQPPR